jgi:hypothetical protein
MLLFAFGLAAAAALLVTLGFRRRTGRPDLGSMSPQWIAACRVSREASTI